MIDSTKLRIKFRSNLIGLSTLQMMYEIFSTDWLTTVIESGTLSNTINKLSDIDDIDAGQQSQLDAILKHAQSYYGAKSALNGLSLFDASLCLEWWLFFQENDGEWKMQHPVSGIFSDVVLTNTPAGRVNAITSAVLPPPAWVWAESPSAGQLSVNCIAVSGADHYAIYNDNRDGTFTHIADAPTEAGGTVAVDAGYYTVRMAAVTSAGVVGVFGVAVEVTVG